MDDDWDVVDDATTRQPEPPIEQEATPATSNAQSVDPWGEADPWGTEDSSASGAFARGAVEGTVPTGAGLAAGIATGAGIGTAVGGPVGTVAGLAGGFIVGGGVGWLASKAQDWVLDKMGLREGTGLLSRQQQQADEAQHPYAREAGSFLPGLLALKPTGSMVQRGVGAVLGGGAEATQELLNGEGVDPTKVAIAAGAGAAFPTLNKRGEKIAAAGSRPFEGAGTGAVQNPVQTNPDTPGRPDLKAVPDATDISKLEFDTANDVTTTSAGVAADNHSAPEIAAAGNPTGAPMQARTAAKPSDPTRDYRKGAQVAAGDVKTQDSTVMSTAPLHEDIAAALNGLPADLKPQLQNPEAPAQRPEPQPPIQTGIEEAGRPPQSETVSDATPNGANGAPDVTVAVTPHEQQIIDITRAELQRQGMTDVLSRLDTLSPKEQAKASGQIIHALESESGEATGPKDVVRMPASRPGVGEGGPMARSKGDAERKSNTLKSVTSVYEEFGPNSEKGKTIDPAAMNKEQAIAYAKEALAAATERNGGKDPLVRSADNYVPVQKGAHTEAYQWLRAVKGLTRQFVSNKAVQDFAALHTSGEGGEGIGALDAETKAIEDNIQRRPSIPDEAAEAILNKAMEGHDTGREDFEAFQSKGEESPVYEGAQNSLRSWLNGLNDVDYRLLSNEHPDLKLNVEATNDPHELLMNLRDDLDMAQKKYPGIIESVPAEEVRAKSKPIRNAAELARFAETKPGAAASSGRALDKNSPEFKAAAEAALKAQPPVKTAERLASEEAAAQGKEPIDGGWDTAKKSFQDLMSDEAGSGKLFKPLEWMAHKVTDLFSPDADAPVRAYGHQLGDSFANLMNKTQTARMSLRANAMAYAAEGLTPADRQKLYRAIQDDTVSSQSKKLQEAYDNYVKPLETKYNYYYDEMRAMDNEQNLGLELPAREKGVEKRFIARIRAGKQTFDAADEGNVDFVTGRTLNNWASTLQDRDFMTLTNQNGSRLVFTHNNDGTINIWKNGSPIKKGVPANFEGNVGDTLTMKGGNATKYTVDHATTEEISAHVKDEEGKPITFHEDPVLAMSQAVNGLQQAVDNQRLLNRIKTDPRFLENSTTDKDVAKERGYDPEPTKLSDLADRNGKTLYMPRSLKWALDDFYQPGFGGRVGTTWRNAATGLAKVFYTLGPVMHGLNEADLWATSRGFDWLPGSGGWKSLAKNGYKAAQSVNAQDAFQDAIRRAGGNPMLASTLTNDLLPQIARRLSVDMTTNASKWDPIAKHWNMTTPQLARATYNQSSKMMWWMSDVLLTHKVMENMDLHGMTMNDAVTDAHKFISDYRVPTTIGGRGDAGRFLQQALVDPATSLFGRYHYGIFNTYANLTKALVKGDMAQRTQAVGQLMASAAMAYMVYPYLAKAAQWVTGDKETEVGSRGLSTIPHALNQIRQGEDIKKVLPSLWTPSIPLKTAYEILHNTDDFTGKPIVAPTDLTNPRNAGKAAVQEADFAARNLVSPYNTLSSAVMRPGSTPKSVAGTFAGSLVGVRTPSNAELKYRAQLMKHDYNNAKSREKKPPGVLEDLYNRATR